MSQGDTAADGSDRDSSRRDFLKVTGAAAATGALGGLAGCTGGGGGGDGNGDGGGSASLTINYLCAEAAENSLTKPLFNKSVKRFGDQNDVQVNLQAASYGDIKSKISSTVSAGNPPTLAEFGSAGLEFFLDDKVPDHGQWVDESDSYPDNWSAASKSVADFRGTYWSGGPLRHSVSNLGIRPKVFSEHGGVSDPFEDLKTWSGFYDALNQIAESDADIIPYEETGVYNDLESYWGHARTAYTGGDDPWIRGDPENPEVLIGSDGENGKRTDGMIKNVVKLANEFSSEKSAQRGDEEIPSLMLTDRVASFTYMTQNFTRWRSVKEDAKIGWHDGDGDVMLLPNPKLDADYGSNVGISELEGLEGEHGGHVWALEQAHGVFDVGDQKKMDAGWDLQVFLRSDEEHVFEWLGEAYPAIPADAPMQEALLNEYTDLPQNFTQVLKNLDNYGTQYNSTGADWDVKGTDQIRWTDINKTISQSIAGQEPLDGLPDKIRSNVDTTLSERN
ncbi:MULTISPECIES: ABC transporter substrate-binding protein [unclassified Haladaptatus]|uniref:ABC transporter substrate-binding protein n=1 Tax=unclassified Haladaptatus TaxID=2622732 RepID=UPI0023E75628|nr:MULTISPECIES: ABC transporter substrate-binding protein [unclassified Haladaptatus]